MDFKKLPKVELHLHLDGSLDIDTVSEISGLTIDEVKSKMVVSENCKDLNEYLSCFEYPVNMLQTKDNLYRFSCDLVKSLENENIIYSEVRFAPLKHINGGLTIEEVIESVLAGLKTSKNIVNLILCCMRDENPTNNLKVVEAAYKYNNKGVVGIDLAGAEALYPTSNFSYIFEKCKELSIPYTIHAGEASGYDSILAAIEFGTTRLGHGVRAIENNELLAKIKENNILLEICPTSNIQTNIYDNYADCPIYDLYKQGIKVCINTDNRTVSNITLSDEYYHLKEVFNEEDFYKMNLYAIESSFANEQDKEKIKYLLKKYMEEVINNSHTNEEVIK